MQTLTKCYLMPNRLTGSLSIYLLIMNILCWNVHDICSPITYRILQDIRKDKNPDILAILEPCCSGSSTEKIIKQLHFSDSHRVEARGFAGGIWVLWKDKCNIDIVQSNSQYIHCCVNKSWFVTFIYGSLQHQPWMLLWNRLARLADNILGPWLVMGDFNNLLLPSEKVGSNRFNMKHASEFQQMMDAAGLQELGFSGNRFTFKRGRLQERLDKTLANTEWCLTFTDFQIEHLFQNGSDHCPLFLRNTRSSYVPMAFKSRAAWQEEGDFKRMLVQA